MLEGENIRLRGLRPADLEPLADLWADLSRRGAYMARPIRTLVALERQYRRDGLWSHDKGELLIEDMATRAVGSIDFFPPHPCYRYYQICFIVFLDEDRNKGYASEAVALLSRYLLAERLVNKLLIAATADNEPAKRVAEKCGYRPEGNDRQAAFINGHFRDLERYSLLRDDMIALGSAV